MILLPPSEGKKAIRRGRPLELTELSLPELTPTRQRVLDATVAAAGAPNALQLFGVAPGLAEDVAGNRALRTRPAARADRVFSGVLYAALGLADLDAAGKRRAARRLLISSALFGALRPADRIPDHRLAIGARLPGLGALTAVWRAALTEPLNTLAGNGLVVDCRSAGYAAMWRPPRADGWVQVTVPGATHHAKHTRGLVAGALCQRSAAPGSAAELADALTGEFRVDLTRATPTSPWQLAVTAR
nr:peroxide stress protein YaaA [Nakamurella aerolata]